MSIARMMQMAAAGVPSGGGGLPTGTILSSFASPANLPVGLAFDASTGNLISSDIGTDLIYIHSGVTSTVSSNFSPPANSVFAMSYDTATGNLIICDRDTDLIYIQDGVSGTNLSSFASPSAEPTGLAYDSSTGNLISSDRNTDLIYIHDGISSTILSSFASPGSFPSGLAMAGTNLVSCDRDTDRIYVHDGITSAILVSFASPSSSPYGLTYNSSTGNLISCDIDSDLIYIHANSGPVVWTNPDIANAGYDSISFSVLSETTNAEDIHFHPVGLVMFILDGTSDNLLRYTLTTAWDITTATYTDFFALGVEESRVRAIAFKSDGTSFYSTGIDDDNVNQYNLTTAWDITTASFSQSFSVATQTGTPDGLTFKPDGTEMYVTDSSVFQYALSSAWDISTASYNSVSFDLSSQDSSPQEAVFNPDGDKMYIVGDSSGSILQYSLSTAWNVSTASYDSISFVVGSFFGGQERDPNGVFFKPDGSKMWVVGSANDTVFQYSTD
jgi:DNA-binding beta-propeller fold protein YncE